MPTTPDPDEACAPDCDHCQHLSGCESADCPGCWLPASTEQLADLSRYVVEFGYAFLPLPDADAWLTIDDLDLAITAARDVFAQLSNERATENPVLAPTSIWFAVGRDEEQKLIAELSAAEVGAAQLSCAARAARLREELAHEAIQYDRLLARKVAL